MDKNGRVRHELSVHDREEWWSCAQLTLQDLYLRDRSELPGGTCGFCGQEFSDWTKLEAHVPTHQPTCTRKIFYRKDHIRQHLVHTHHAAKGRWLERLVAAASYLESQYADRRRAS